MTDLQLEPGQGSVSSWDDAYAALRARFPTATDSVAFAIFTFQTDPSISLDDLKARGLMHRVRITAHSVNAAQRLMMGTKAPARPTSPPTEPSLSTALASVAAPALARPVRRTRERAPQVDVADLVQQTIAKLQQESGQEAARLREAIRQAVEVLRAAVS